MIQLADTGTLFKSLENILAFHQKQISKVDHFCLRIMGLSGLNYLLQIIPDYIHFVGLSQESIDYQKLLLEILKISRSPQEFISRIFCRNVSILTTETQFDFLSEKYSEDILEDNFSKLSEEAKKNFEKFLKPFLPGEVLFSVEGCRRLLPCWPIKEKVPFSCGDSMGENFLGELEPNTNTFFYGSAWLSEHKTFQHVKGLLETLPLDFFLSSSSDWSSILDFSQSNVLHMAFQPEEEVLKLWKESMEQSGGSLHIVTEGDGIQNL
jgi:hypothetical protein